MTRKLWRVAVAPLLLLLLAAILPGQNLEEFEKRVTEFTLDNGVHFIVIERHDAPVVSFHALVNAGATNDPGGKTGIAHMFEHMIGKGTMRVGTTNWPEEKQALDTVEESYSRLEEERRKGLQADKERVEALEKELAAAIEVANSYVVQNEFPRVVEENGGVGFNAGTGLDATQYFYSLPANRMELWFLLQSEWFRNPIYREFYKERDVVREERRMRIESSPVGKLQEALMTSAFIAHPYKSIIGWASDIENLRVGDAQSFHETYYVPSNITIAVSGDVDPKAVRRLAEKYYGRLPAGPPPPGVITVEPEQYGERRVVVESPTQPYVMIAYHRPNQTHPDDPVFEVISGVLASGRTGILYKEMVRDSQIALTAGTSAAFPAAKYPSLFLLYSVPNMGKTVAENEEAIYGILERLKTEKVDEETLQRVKTKVRASVIRQLDSNAGLASTLTFYHVNYGDWRMLFKAIDVIGAVTADDVQRVVKEYFTAKNRTVAYHVKPPAETADTKESAE